MENPTSSFTPPSQRIKTVHNLLDGYRSLSVPTLLAPLAEDFRHRALPASLEMPERDRVAFASHAAGVFGLFDAFEMVPQSVHEDAATNVVVVHALMKGVMKMKQLDWRNECILLIRLSADGTRVQEISEFVDSAKAVEMRRKHAPGVFGKAGGALAGVRFSTLVAGFSQIVVLCATYHAVSLGFSWYFNSGSNSGSRSSSATPSVARK
ncbi:hypothetical protein PG996_001252 [Apiospora saccharicola]|uniref:Uncharacterized protein n=1 Tax=Apiospora saccharicola TaxID=335842 RepID=A0ABR1WG24_9PEZI